MMFDYSKVRGKIREKFCTQAAFASKMEFSSTTLSNKLNNKAEWTQQEICTAVNLLDISENEIPTYFFLRKEEGMSDKKRITEVKMNVVNCENCTKYTEGICYMTKRKMKKNDFCNNGKQIPKADLIYSYEWSLWTPCKKCGYSGYGFRKNIYIAKNTETLKGDYSELVCPKCGNAVKFVKNK